MRRRWLEEAVAACGLPPCPKFPRRLAEEVLLSLPVTLVPLAHLTSEDVRAWLARRGVHHRVADIHRSIHGCMVAWAERGVIFYDTADGENQQRFTLAHEVSHFVLDHLLPRTRALQAFGREILPVLDGRRDPTPEECLSSVLDQIPIGLQVKLMDRGPSNSTCAGRVAKSEQRADCLALELLAPAEHVLGELRGAPGDGVARVASRFGLPPEVARMYVGRLLRRQRTPRFSILKFLGEDRR